MYTDRAAHNVSLVSAALERGYLGGTEMGKLKWVS